MKETREAEGTYRSKEQFQGKAQQGVYRLKVTKNSQPNRHNGAAGPYMGRARNKVWVNPHIQTRLQFGQQGEKRERKPENSDEAMSENAESDREESMDEEKLVPEVTARQDSIYNTEMNQGEDLNCGAKRKKQSSESDTSDFEPSPKTKENYVRPKAHVFTNRDGKKPCKVTAESGHGGSSSSMWANNRRNRQLRSRSRSSDEGEKETNMLKKGSNEEPPPQLERAIRYKARINSMKIQGRKPSERIAQIWDKITDTDTLWAVHFNETSYGGEIIFVMTTEKARDELVKMPIGEKEPVYMEPVTVETLSEKRRWQVRVRDLYQGISEDEGWFSLREYGSVISLWLEHRRGMVQAIVEYEKPEMAEKVIALKKVYVGGDHAFTYPMDNWMEIEQKRKKYLLKLSNLPFNCSGKEIDHWLLSIKAIGITIK